MVRKTVSASLIPTGKIKRAAAGVAKRVEPDLKEARAQFKVVQRDVVRLERSVRKATVDLARSEGDRAAAKVARAVLAAQTRLLKAAQRTETKSSAALAKLIARDAERSRVAAQAKAMDVYRKKLAKEAESDLAKFIHRLETNWTRARAKVDTKRIKVKLKKESLKAAALRKKTMTKAGLAAHAALLVASGKARKAKKQVSKKVSKVVKKIGL